MVDDLLDTSRITRGTFQLRMERVRPAELIERAVATVRTLPMPRALSGPYDNTCATDWRPTRLGWNRSSATCLPMPSSSRRRAADRALRQDGGGDVVLTVRDTGSDCPDFLPHVFDSFAQANKSLAREEEDSESVLRWSRPSSNCTRLCRGSKWWPASRQRDHRTTPNRRVDDLAGSGLRPRGSADSRHGPGAVAKADPGGRG